MKKKLFVGCAVALLAVSCKKDRVCACTEQVEDSPVKLDYTVTMHDVGYKRAYTACVHTKETYKIDDTTEVTVDIYCELQ